MDKVKKNLLFSSLIVLVSCLVVTGCQVQHNGQNKSEKHGGTLRINASNVPDIIFPGQILKNSEHLLVNQVYSGLVKYHPKTLEIIPSLAKTWRVEQNSTLYTFTLRQNALFHSDACFKNNTRKIVAHDVKFSIEQICRNHLKSDHTLSWQIFNITGSDSLYNEKKNLESLSIDGIHVINDTTLQFKLKQPDEMFIHFLAGPNTLVFPKEGFAAYGLKNTVGSGAFTFNYPKIKGEPITLAANPNFFMKNNQGEQLPFLDSVIVSFITSTTRELFLFKQGKIDAIVGLTHNYIAPFLDENIDRFQSNPPYYILKPTPTNSQNTKYNLMRANIQQFEINAQQYYDLSRVYIADPEEETIQVNSN